MHSFRYMLPTGSCFRPQGLWGGRRVCSRGRPKRFSGSRKRLPIWKSWCTVQVGRSLVSSVALGRVPISVSTHGFSKISIIACLLNLWEEERMKALFCFVEKKLQNKIMFLQKGLSASNWERKRLKLKAYFCLSCTIIESTEQVTIKHQSKLRYPTSFIFHLSVFMPSFPYVFSSYLFFSVRTFQCRWVNCALDIIIAWLQLPRWMSLRRRMRRSSAGCSGSAALRTAGRPTAWTALASTPTAASARTWRRCSHRSRTATELHAVLIVMVHRNRRHWRFAVYPQMLNSIRDCFVTGKWEEGQDAATLLKEDGEWRRWKSESSNTEVFFFFYRQCGRGLFDAFK